MFHVPKQSSKFSSWAFPEIPDFLEDLIQQNDEKLVVVGKIGKSHAVDLNKFILKTNKTTNNDDAASKGEITFHYNVQDSLLILNFETTFDGQYLKNVLKNKTQTFLKSNQELRNRFARMLLLATQICHIIVFVELNLNLDTSFLSLFKAVKIIRDQYVLKFLPKLIKNANIGHVLGRNSRLCTPRFLYFVQSDSINPENNLDTINKLEEVIEDDIYKLFRNECIITNNNNSSLFNLSNNKKFVYYNIDENVHYDPLEESLKLLHSIIHKPNNKDDLLEDFQTLLPYQCFGGLLSEYRPWVTDDLSKEHGFMSFLKQHVKEVLENGLSENIGKCKKQHKTTLTFKDWYTTFELFHSILVDNGENAAFETKDADYKYYLENFNRIVNIDNDFFNTCGKIGLKKAYNLYNNPTLTHYSEKVHEKMLNDAIDLYKKYARGTQMEVGLNKLSTMCLECWKNGRQQCCVRSLRGNECILPLHASNIDFPDHSSGFVFISTCNCGRTQARRDDPYTIRSANYEFYEYLEKNCNLCIKAKKIHMPVFKPSINNYRAADVEASFPKLPNNGKICSLTESELSIDLHHNMASQSGIHSNLSLTSTDHLNKLAVQVEDDDNISSEEDHSISELVLQLQEHKSKKNQESLENDVNIEGQPSTTEYLPGMVHAESPIGLLPQFPSWSLVCVGISSVYSHNTGISEHFQNGFLSGANFLLPWDVNVRLENTNAWSSSVYEISRYRKLGSVIVLKIFLGCEYECLRGHRFIMSSPDKVLRGSSGVPRDSGSKIAYNNMPLYFSCPCRAVGQLMRIHVVTPKAPVNVILNPKVYTGGYKFTLGLPNPPKLSQSAYWVLRLPYVYQGDDGAILPPTEITSQTALSHGFLLAGMFGVSEIQVDDLDNV